MEKHEAELVVRPMGRVLARELTQEEIQQVAAGCNTSGGNACTTGTGQLGDRDHQE